MSKTDDYLDRLVNVLLKLDVVEKAAPATPKPAEPEQPVLNPVQEMFANYRSPKPRPEAGKPLPENVIARMFEKARRGEE